MHKINIRKFRHLVQRVLLLALLALPLLGFVQTPMASAASCPKGQTAKITHGSICKTTGEVTCDTGFLPQYSGSSVVCADASAITSCPASQLGQIPGGTICQSTGQVACSSGYSPQYNGSSVICVKPATPPPGKTNIATSTGDVCGGGGGNDSVKTAINIGCKGKGNPIMDATFAIIRFLTTGVGIVLVGSMIFAGIQYTASRGDPQATASAVNRLRANAWALLLFLFGYAILNYLIPGTFLR